MPARRIVVGEGEVDRAVAVEIDPLHAVRRPVLGDDLHHRVGKARAVVVVQKIVLVDRFVHIRRDVKIRAAVVVVIAPVRRGRFFSAGYAHGFGHFLEAAAALVVKQKVASVPSHE